MNTHSPNTITEKKQKGKKIIIRKPNKKKVNEGTKLIEKNTGSKEEKMTEQMTSFYEDETICSKCPLPLTDDDMAMGDGTMCEDCYDKEQQQQEDVAEYRKFTEQVNKDFTTALAYAQGIINGFSQKCVMKYAFGDSVSDEIEAFMDAVNEVIKKEWRIKIFNHYYGYDYVWFNGEPLEKDYFEGEYPKMVDKEGNKIIKLETGEYITQKKKIKLKINK